MAVIYGGCAVFQNKTHKDMDSTYNTALTREQRIEQRHREAQEIAQNDGIRNLFVNFENGDSALVYCNQTNIGCGDVKRFAEKVTGDTVLEVYHVPQSELQYYCIGGRVWIDTPEKARKLLDTIN